jgi:hypothetical protein
LSVSICCSPILKISVMLRDQPLQTVETFIYSVEITSLGVKKSHIDCDPLNQCPLLGVKRTLSKLPPMSALPKADIRS